ncbi:MAG: MlaD family protein [Acidobacteriota bacterium]
MSQALRVGVFVSLCLAVIGYLVFQIEDFRFFGEEGQRIDVVFDSVAGLNEKAPVRVAGVRVGTVDGVALDGRRARVTLLIDTPLTLTEGSRAAIANAGILGDKYVELIPGPAGAPALAGEVLLSGSTPVSFDEALGRFDKLGQSLTEVTGDISAQGDLGQTIRRLLENLEATSADIRALVSANRNQVDSTVANFQTFSEVLARELPEVTRQMRSLLSNVDTLVVENRDELSGSLDNIERLSEEIATSVDNLNHISSQIRSGEGTLGKLVYDDAAHDGLVNTLEAVEQGVGTLNETIGRVQQLELQLGLEATSYLDLEEGGAAFELRLKNHPRRFYRLALVDTPQGDLSEETRTITTTLPDGSQETTVITERKMEDDFTVSAQLGYLWGDFQLRAGLIESAGGAGIDYQLFDQRLTLTFEAFDFDRPDDLDPHLRFVARWQMTPNVYLIGGYDDFLADEFESVIFGAGIRWKDEDLKYLLGSVPLSF